MNVKVFKKFASASFLCGLVVFASACDENTNDPVDTDPVSTGRSVFGVDASGNLLRFGATSPNVITMTKPVTGLQGGEKIVGIDFRPKDGKLYGIGSASRIYTIDTASAVATAVGNGFTPAIMGADIGWDFNPVADRLRLHTNEDQDLRLHPETGALGAIDSTLKYAAGDVNFGLNPTITATAYTNSDADTNTKTTELFAIDANLDILVKLASPNNGQLTTIGTLGVLTSNAAGFDIPVNTGIAYAALSTGATGGSSLYTIDLVTGKATLVGAIQNSSPIVGIAVAP